MQKISYFRSVLLFIPLIVLTACGGSDSAPAGVPAPAGPKTGIIVGPVAGIAYKTEKLSGTTNAQGQFNYLPGENVTFSIGDINFPSITAKSLVTPLDMASTTDTANPTVINIIRLLQTLDSSEGLNVIDIDTNAATAASGITLNFTLSVIDFEAAAAVFLTAAVGDPNLVAEADAIARFESVLANLTLVGAWSDVSSENINDEVVVIFLDDSRYFLLASNNSQYDAVLGTVVPVSAEYGTYTWDPVTGAFAANAIGESDGEGGLSSPNSRGEAGASAVVDGASLTYTAPGEGAFPLTKIAYDSGILGAWVLDDNVIIFLEDSHYFVGHARNTEFDPVLGTVVPVSAEYGTYTWDSVTGALTTNVIGQSDGQGGLSDPLGDQSIVVDGTNLTLTDSGEGTYSLIRIE